MGRGIAYQYEFFMLLSDLEWDDWDYEDFKDSARKSFDAYEVKEHHGRDSIIIGRCDRLSIGIDTGGGCPCIFLEPQEYEHISGEYKEYKIYRDAVKGFNKLIKVYPNSFSRPTSAWTSTQIDKYE